ncbi:MAG: hypothetical protein IKW54_02260 [Bacteroidales bacterium]|nr:hypothetical protein [Bacteroidales bacterium]
MKLTTNNGELDLPVDFSFEVELNNPFFSDEGDSTIPATIPATPNNLKVLDNIHRVDRADRFLKTTPATLMAGVIQKHGQLIIDTLSMKNGIAVSLAIENSDVYSQYKSKSLKEIFASKVRDEWNRDIKSLANHLLAVRFNRKTDDFTIFPVAVSPYEEDETKTYQYNNEGTNYLVWQARTVREGDLTMSVTDGYGLSPFLYLYKMIDLLFEQMGYYVVYNCLDRDPYRDIVLLNNCADTIVKGLIKYSDLVPSCTLSEFLDFLHNKFGIFCRIDSTSKRVRVIMLQDLLSSSAPDMDITSKVVDDLDITIEDNSRVILSSETSIDDTAPAAETFDKLIEKYGYYIEITEKQYANMQNDIPINISDCLVMRQETGQFYELRRNIGANKVIPTYVGTNYFKYDRENSSNQESFNSPDVMPAIIYDRLPYMYIGDRLHRNTTCNYSEESSEQPIMIAWKTITLAGNIAMTFGTTQKYFDGRKIKDFSLTTYDMYEYFWSCYNNLLRSGKIKLKGTVLFDISDMASIDMSRVKIYKGQKLLPLTTVFEISDKLKNRDSEFLLVKEFLNSEKDKTIAPETKQRYKWESIVDVPEVYINQLNSHYPIYYNGMGFYVGRGASFNIQEYNKGWDSNEDANPMEVYVSFAVLYNGYTVKSNTETEIYIGPPQNNGEKSIRYEIDSTLVSKEKLHSVDLYGNIGGETSSVLVDSSPIEIECKSYLQYFSIPV